MRLIIPFSGSLTNESQVHPYPPFRPYYAGCSGFNGGSGRGSRLEYGVIFGQLALTKANDTFLDMLFKQMRFLTHGPRRWGGYVVPLETFLHESQ